MKKNKNITRGRPKNSGVVSRPLTKEEIKRLLSVTLHGGQRTATAQRNHALLMFGFYTAARIGELCSLQVKDVWENNEVASSVLFQKTKTKRAGGFL